MQILNILTTATPRPELHEKTIFDTIAKLNTEFNIHWFINLDCPNMISEEQKAISIVKLVTFCEKFNVKYDLMFEHSGSNFSTAAKRLYQNCKIEEGNNIFFWLEDDWVFSNFQKEFISEIKDFFTNSKDFILTTNTRYVTGNPILFKEDFFKLIISKYDTMCETIDPELLLLACTKQKYSHPTLRMLPPNCTYFAAPVFIDVGRQWRAERSIQKLDKFNTSLENTWSI